MSVSVDVLIVFCHKEDSSMSPIFYNITDEKLTDDERRVTTGSGQNVKSK